MGVTSTDKSQEIQSWGWFSILASHQAEKQKAQSCERWAEQTNVYISWLLSQTRCHLNEVRGINFLCLRQVSCSQKVACWHRCQLPRSLPSSLEGLACMRKQIFQPLCDHWVLHGETCFQIHAFEGEGCEPALRRATTMSFSGEDAPSLLAQGGAGEGTQVKNTASCYRCPTLYVGRCLL